MSRFARAPHESAGGERVGSKACRVGWRGEVLVRRVIGSGRDRLDNQRHAAGKRQPARFRHARMHGHGVRSACHEQLQGRSQVAQALRQAGLVPDEVIDSHAAESPRRVAEQPGQPNRLAKIHHYRPRRVKYCNWSATPCRKAVGRNKLAQFRHDRNTAPERQSVPAGTARTCSGLHVPNEKPHNVIDIVQKPSVPYKSLDRLTRRTNATSWAVHLTPKENADASGSLHPPCVSQNDRWRSGRFGRCHTSCLLPRWACQGPLPRATASRSAASGPATWARAT